MGSWGGRLLACRVVEKAVDGGSGLCGDHRLGWGWLAEQNSDLGVLDNEAVEQPEGLWWVGDVEVAGVGEPGDVLLDQWPDPVPPRSQQDLGEIWGVHCGPVEGDGLLTGEQCQQPGGEDGEGFDRVVVAVEGRLDTFGCSVGEVLDQGGEEPFSAPEPGVQRLFGCTSPGGDAEHGDPLVAPLDQFGQRSIDDPLAVLLLFLFARSASPRGGLCAGGVSAHDE